MVKSSRFSIDFVSKLIYFYFCLNKKTLYEKDQSILSLEKLLQKYESDREQYDRLLDQSHNDKQTISRILTQNNDLKNQLNELQDVYVNVTNQNLDLATKLESEKFRLKQLEEKSPTKFNNQQVEALVSAPNSENSNNNNNRDLESEWDDDAVLVNNSSLSSSSFNSESNKVAKPKSNTLMNSIKVTNDLPF
jgi:TolA-binding protein